MQTKAQFIGIAPITLNEALYRTYSRFEVHNALHKLFSRILVTDNGQKCTAFKHEFRVELSSVAANVHTTYSSTAANTVTCDTGNALELLIALYEHDIAYLIESSIITSASNGRVSKAA